MGPQPSFLSALMRLLGSRIFRMGLEPRSAAVWLGNLDHIHTSSGHLFSELSQTSWFLEPLRPAVPGATHTWGAQCQHQGRPPPSLPLAQTGSPPC